MYTAKESELIDFSALIGDHAPERSRLLMENLTSLLELTAPTCSDEQLDVYDNVLLRLVSLVETEAKKTLAGKLSVLSRAPCGIVRTMAADEIEVAEPILRHSKILDAVDLKYLAETKSDDHLAVISCRDDLETSITDVIIGRGGVPVMVTLIRNPLAPVSRSGFASLIEKSRENLQLQEGLGDRVDFPGDLLQTFVAVASDAVRKRLSARLGDPGQSDSEDMLDAALEIAGAEIVANLSREIAGAYYDFDEALARVRKLAQTGGLTQEYLVDVACRDQFADVVWSHSLLSGLPFDQALAQLTAPTPDSFLIAARASDFDERAVRAILRCGPWRNATSPHVVETAMTRFRRLTRATAQRIIQGWRPAQSA